MLSEDSSPIIQMSKGKMEVDIYEFIKDQFKKQQKEHLDPILAQTKETNGRVTKLENFKNIAYGAFLAIGFVIGYPKIAALLISLFS